MNVGVLLRLYISTVERYFDHAKSSNKNVKATKKRLSSRSLGAHPTVHKVCKLVASRKDFEARLFLCTVGRRSCYHVLFVLSLEPKHTVQCHVKARAVLTFVPLSSYLTNV